MYARVTELAGFGERLDEYVRRVDELVLPPLREVEGYAGYLNLVDRDGDRVLVVSIWETRETMRASRERVLELRRQAADAVGAGERWVREYEVALSEP